jgi:hypothetical protein
MAWLLDEDFALKIKLQGMTVTDSAAPSGRPVPVKFRLPQTELSDLTYPIVTIDHNGWYLAPEREHRGFIQLPYAPEGFEPWWDTSDPSNENFNPSDSPYWSFFPKPYNLDYVVTVYTRVMRDHMIPIISQLAQYKRLDAHFGFLDVPQDGTKRTLQLLGGPSLTDEYDGDGKRVFATKYIVRVFSELIPEVIQFVSARIINLDLSEYNSIEDISTTQQLATRGLISAGIRSMWNIAEDI